MSAGVMLAIGRGCVALPLPYRVQLRRTKGWRKPEGVVVVSRPSKWGNPFTIAGCIDAGFAADATAARHVCADAFRSCLLYGFESPWWAESAKERFYWIVDHLDELRGRNLACWCPLGDPCHADVLIELANEVTS